MDNGIKTIYPYGLNKGISSRLCVSSRLRYETPEQGRGTHQQKRCEYNNKDEDNSPNFRGDKNDLAFSEKFRQKGR